MFFIIGADQREIKLDYNKLMTCEVCSSMGRYDVYMTFMVFTFFFIPLIRWNKKYYVKTSCCNSLYELNPEVGKMIEKGENVDIRSEDLTLLSEKHNFKKCFNCGYQTDQDFVYCPKCGNKF